MSAAVRTLMGFDFGEKRIGVAVGNTLTRAAEPLLTLTEVGVDARFARIEALLKQWQPAMLVVGRPLHPDGQPHQITALAEKFARRLQGRFGLPVALVDERFSTVAAQERLDARDDWADGEGRRARARGGRSGRRPRAASGHGDDAAAAAVILEQYLSENPDE